MSDLTLKNGKEITFLAERGQHEQEQISMCGKTMMSNYA